MNLLRVLSLATAVAVSLPANALSQEGYSMSANDFAGAPPSARNTYGAGTNPYANFAAPPRSSSGSSPRSSFGAPLSAASQQPQYSPDSQNSQNSQNSQRSQQRPSYAAPLPSGYRPSFSASLSQQDLAILGARDVIVLIDKSGSMNELDCPAPTSGGRAMGMLNMFAGAAGMRRSMMPGMVSRWDWAGSQLMSLAGVTSGVLPRGITTVFFDGNATVYNNVSVQQIPHLFARQRPEGTTDVTGALREQLNDYFKRKERDPQTRPLAIAVVTDGLPNNINSLKSVLVDASRSITRPDEIAVTFLQVGRERKGFELLTELDDGLYSRGARFDIVDSKVFPEVVRFGLARALVLAITERANG